MTTTKPTNDQIADVLERIAELLEFQDTNPFRVNAYRFGGQTIRSLDKSAADFVINDKMEALKALPGIGEGLAAVIGEVVSTGKSNLLENLESDAPPEAVFTKVPGIGHELAERIVDRLHIQTLPELEEAAHDGRLEMVHGFGKRRVEAVRASLAGMLKRPPRRANGKSQKKPVSPSVDLLLRIDEEYRNRAQAGDLQKIAPKRFNPDNKAWLPIMHAKRDGWDFTALFSNTAQAHKLGKTDDWVVIYFERNGKEHQHTIVTETKGTLEGKRVVRGR